MESPSKSEVVEKLRSLASGTASREDVSRWAEKWVAAGTPPRMERNLWDAVKFLYSADAISLDRPYLYDVEDFQRELVKLR